jgi:hypothetical protein
MAPISQPDKPKKSSTPKRPVLMNGKGEKCPIKTSKIAHPLQPSIADTLPAAVISRPLQNAIAPSLPVQRQSIALTPI